MAEIFQRLGRFLRELKRRSVYRVAVTYLTVAFVGFQAAQLLIPATVLPEWSDEFFLFFLIVGFPVAVVVAWAFEMTPEGVRRTTELESGVGARDEVGDERRPGEADGAEEAAPPPRSGGRAGPGYALLVGLGLLAAAGAGVWYLTGGGDPTPESGSRSVAVLPFEELGRDEPGAFTEGMHEEVVTRLSNVSGVTVTSGRAARRYRGTDKTTAEIARELGVKWLLTGGVQQVGDGIEVRARLIDPRTDTNAWADEYRRDEMSAENVFAIQEEITREIVRSLQAELTRDESERISRRPTESLDAYRLYLRGRPLLDQRAEAEVRAAVGYFERALARDSSFALAWSGLADARSLLWFYGYAPTDSVSEPALAAARRAVELAPDLGEAQASLGIVRSLRQEGPAALERLRRAVELKPSHPEAHIWLSWVRVLLGQPERALAPGRRAVEIDPLAPPYRVYLAEALMANGRDEEALAQARRAVELRPEYGLAHFVEGLALHHLGRHREAEAAWGEARSLVPPDGAPTHAEIHAAVASARAASGDTAGARERLSRIDGAATPFAKAQAHAAVGELDRAFEALERVEDWGSFTNENARYYFPGAVGALRADPRFEAFRRRLDRAWGLTADGAVPSGNS